MSFKMPKSLKVARELRETVSGEVYLIMNLT